MRKELKRNPVHPDPRARSRSALDPESHPIEPSFLPLQTGQYFSLPALLDALNPRRRDVNRHSVLEPRTEQSMHVRMRRPVHSAMLMNRENALRPSQGTAKRLVDSVAQNAGQETSVEPREPCRRGVVDRQDEAEVDRASEVSTILAEGPSDG